MIGPPRYVLDSNVFMEAARRYYAFDLAPSFWRALIDQARDGRVESIDRVKEEIDLGKDLLTDWANSDFRQWFISTDQADVIGAYGQVMVWAHGQRQFTDGAKAEFSREENADPWVIAYAKAKGCVVVTHEQFDPNVRARIPIPNVCQTYDIQYVDTFQMLRDLGVRLG
jgi:hypothetical protein